jgi:hypothetical protein
MISQGQRRKFYGKSQSSRLIISKDIKSSLARQQLKHQIIQKLCENQQKILGKSKSSENYLFSPNFIQESNLSNQKFQRLKKSSSLTKTPPKSKNVYKGPEDYFKMFQRVFCPHLSSSLSVRLASDSQDLKSIGLITTHGRVNSQMASRLSDLLNRKNSTISNCQVSF